MHKNCSSYVNAKFVPHCHSHTTDAVSPKNIYKIISMCGWQYVGWDHISQGAPYHYATAQVEQRCLQLYMQMEQVDQRRAQDVQELEEVEGRH